MYLLFLMAGIPAAGSKGVNRMVGAPLARLEQLEGGCQWVDLVKMDHRRHYYSEGAGDSGSLSGLRGAENPTLCPSGRTNWESIKCPCYNEDAFYWYCHRHHIVRKFGCEGSDSS